MESFSFTSEVHIPQGMVKVDIEGRGSAEVPIMPGDNLGDVAAMARCVVHRLPMMLAGAVAIEHFLEFISFDPSTNTLKVRNKK